MTPDLLDNIGLTVKISDLPSAARMQWARQNLWGTHWLSRWYKQHIFWWLTPKAYTWAIDEYAAARRQVSDECFYAIMDKAKDAANDA